ncbi:MAG: cation transporter [Myxococcota bacterium]|jgi:thiol-disulfide isomerase/thioredoxin|nr:cation transporter [Myxococcota bacterium]
MLTVPFAGSSALADEATIPDTPEATAGFALLEIQGMTCGGCHAKVVATLRALPGVQAAAADHDQGLACVSWKQGWNPEASAAAIAAIEYEQVSAREVDTCPPGLELNGHVDPWANVEGLDVTTISNGETVDLGSHLEPDHFTIIDFSAPWCGPCHEAARRLSEYLAANEDVAVRVVHLAASDATGSFALPVAQQHLQSAPGIPWFLVYSPRGRVIYRGPDVENVLTRIDRKRR